MGTLNQELTDRYLELLRNSEDLPIYSIERNSPSFIVETEEPFNFIFDNEKEMITGTEESKVYKTRKRGTSEHPPGMYLETRNYRFNVYHKSARRVNTGWVGWSRVILYEDIKWTVTPDYLETSVFVDSWIPEVFLNVGTNPAEERRSMSVFTNSFVFDLNNPDFLAVSLPLPSKILSSDIDKKKRYYLVFGSSVPDYLVNVSSRIFDKETEPTLNMYSYLRALHGVFVSSSKEV